jgi:hypothetical protein
MLVLFDHVTPRGVARSLTGHTVTKAVVRQFIVEMVQQARV